MKQNFRLGNIFSKDKIRDVKEIEDLIDIEEGTDISAREIYSRIPDWKSGIEERLGGKVNFSYITYSSGAAFLDIFVVGDEKSEVGKFNSGVKIPKGLDDNLRRYQEVIRKVIDEQKSLSQDAKEGHFLSEGAVREYEEKFLEEVPQNLDKLIKVLQSSRYEDQRATAAYLLQWQPDKELAVRVLLEVLENDPDHSVHNSAARALIALTHKVPIPSKKIHLIFNLLSHPAAICINKGIYLVLELFKRQQVPGRVVNRHLALIRELSKVRQPNISVPAHEILNLISLNNQGK